VSLRRRLFLFVFVPVVLSYLAFGLFGTFQTRSQLIADLDNDLILTAANTAAVLEQLETQEITTLLEPARSQRSPQFTVLVAVRSGEIALDPASGLDEPGQRPEPSAFAPASLAATLGEPFELSSVDGTIDYRAVATRIDGGRLVVVGQSLERIDALARSWVIGTILTGVFIAAAMAAVVQFAIRSGLKPLDDFVSTTTRIAQGDLSERVNTNQTTPAFAQVAAATNTMLDEIEQSNEQRRLARQQLNDLIANAAHELRTPLTAIRGTVDMQKMGMLNEDERRSVAFAGLDQHSDRMAKIVEDLIVLARADNLRMAVQTDTSSIVDIGAAITARVDHFASLNAATHVVSAEVADGVHEVAGDERLLQTAIDHLLQNAVQHTPPGTSVTVNVSSTNDDVHVAVSDTGNGIPAELQDTLFERFARADDSRARSTGGTGLGLSIVKSVLQSAGGDVALSSHPEAGCELVITLPKFARTIGDDTSASTPNP